MRRTGIGRRSFVAGGLGAGAALMALAARGVGEEPESPRRIRVGVIGCGSVSNAYLPHLSRSPFVELVSVCDRIPERAAHQAGRFGIPEHHPDIDRMLAGAPFELLVNLTDMQEHEHLNRRAIEAGRHVWSEKPMANTPAAGRELLDLAQARGVRIWGAPAVVTSPQFAFMARTIASGALGRLAAAHADYGHEGPDWSAFFYEAGGGSLPDLGVYNLTSVTGLLGPARSVAAMTSVVTPTRAIRDRGEVAVAAEDNAMVLLDHGDGVISHVQSGFNYFNPHGHDGSGESRHTIRIVGNAGAMGLVGYDWKPLGVDLATRDRPAFSRMETDRGSYVWEEGASTVAECLATGREPPFTAEHALHVLEIIDAARRSQQSGRRIELSTTFPWPVLSRGDRPHEGPGPDPTSDQGASS